MTHVSTNHFQILSICYGELVHVGVVKADLMQ